MRDEVGFVFGRKRDEKETRSPDLTVKTAYIPWIIHL